ncbi:hypothetical protein PtA15_8A437 [Puccinia triticina]|uniref:Secreted protein n=2 Tax=Puccinia triticina TaxID=208348 RepID=A0ABY7CQJ6_9BASI|nr:uncharacterized protein PtA15_8A437 [Puccinia triticina]WAQ87533.1 hypothetical protein PtA15_8A437 [Puccinia triticina]
MKLIFFLVPLFGSLVASPVWHRELGPPSHDEDYGSVWAAYPLPDEDYGELPDSWVPHHELDDIPDFTCNWGRLHPGFHYHQEEQAAHEKTVLPPIESYPEPHEDVPNHNGSNEDEQFGKEYPASHADPLSC